MGDLGSQILRQACCFPQLYGSPLVHSPAPLDC
uniref:Uncharacterized protein n=1 Tax=Rhizophora mucronata TaxID=61149 RepID=A0A2P2J4I2_RHIMU